MRIKGKFNFKSLIEFFVSMGMSFVIGLMIFGFFALLAAIHWIIAWMLVSFIITPIVFWFLRYQDGKIEIDPIEDEEEDSSYEFIDTGY